jgi:hypothetical protein
MSLNIIDVVNSFSQEYREFAGDEHVQKFGGISKRKMEFLVFVLSQYFPIENVTININNNQVLNIPFIRNAYIHSTIDIHEIEKDLDEDVKFMINKIWIDYSLFEGFYLFQLINYTPYWKEHFKEKKNINLTMEDVSKIVSEINIQVRGW